MYKLFERYQRNLRCCKAACYFLFLFSFQINAQNIIVDHSFENIACPDNTIGSFYQDENWKATGADVYLMRYNCELDPVDIQAIVAINPEIIPFERSAYISLEGIIFKNGYCLSEGVSQKLETPVTKDSYYYIELATLKYGLENPFEEIPENCFSFPDRGLELRLDNKHIEFEAESKTVDFQPLICSRESTSQLIFNDIHQEDFDTSDKFWNVYWNCFKADSDFEYFSITGPNKFFNDLNECMAEALPGIQHVTGYAIDNILLYEIPKSLDTTITLCVGSTSFSVLDVLDAPFMDKATFEWDDGKTGGERTFSKPGKYVLNMELPCVNVEILVDVIDGNCNVLVHVPNVISINESSPNNRLKPILISDFLIEDYQWSIYDRWGNQIFSTTTIDDYWDGTNSNHTLETGVYVWKLDYAINNGLIKEQKFGTITVLK